MAKRKTKHAHLVEPTWGQSDTGGPPLTELTSESAGALSPFATPRASSPRAQASTSATNSG